MTNPPAQVMCPICGDNVGMTAVVGELTYKVRFCPKSSSGPIPPQGPNELRCTFNDGHVVFALRKPKR